MNQAFRIIWNRTKQLWQCVSEETRARGKSKSEKRPSAAGKVAAVLAAVIGVSTLPMVAQATQPLGDSVKASHRLKAKEAKLIYGYYSGMTTWPEFNSGGYPASMDPDTNDPTQIDSKKKALPLWALGNTQFFVASGTSSSTTDILADLKASGHEGLSGIVSQDPMAWMAMTPYQQTTFGSAYQDAYGYELSTAAGEWDIARPAVAQFQNGIRVERGVHVGDDARLILNQDVEATISGQIVLGSEDTQGAATVTLEDFAKTSSFYGDQYAYRDVENQPTTQSALNLSSTSTWGSTRHNALFRSLNTGAHTLSLITNKSKATQIDWTTLAALEGDGRENTTFTTLELSGDVVLKNVLTQGDKLTTVHLVGMGQQVSLSSNVIQTGKTLTFDDETTGSTFYVDQGNTLLLSHNLVISPVSGLPTLVANDDVVVLEDTADTSSDNSGASEGGESGEAATSAATESSLQISHLILSDDDRPYWMGNKPSWVNGAGSAWSFYSDDSHLHIVTTGANGETVDGSSSPMGRFASWTIKGGAVRLKGTFAHPIKIDNGVVTIEDGTQFTGVTNMGAGIAANGLEIGANARVIFEGTTTIALSDGVDIAGLTPQGTWVVNNGSSVVMETMTSGGNSNASETPPANLALSTSATHPPFDSLFDGQDSGEDKLTDENSALLNPQTMLELGTNTDAQLHMDTTKLSWDGKTVSGWIIETDAGDADDEEEMWAFRDGLATVTSHLAEGGQGSLYTTSSISKWQTLQAGMAKTTDSGFTTPVKAWIVGADSTLTANGGTAWLPGTIYVPQGKKLTIEGTDQSRWLYSDATTQSRSQLNIGGEVTFSGATTVMEHNVVLADNAKLSVVDGATLRVINGNEVGDGGSNNTLVGTISIGKNVEINAGTGTIDLSGRAPGVDSYYGTNIQVVGEGTGWWDALATAENAQYIKLTTYVPFTVTQDMQNFGNLNLWDIRNEATVATGVDLPQVTHLHGTLTLNGAIGQDKTMMVMGTLIPEGQLQVDGNLTFLPGATLDLRHITNETPMSVNGEVSLYEPEDQPLSTFGDNLGLTIKVGGKDGNDSTSAQWNLNASFVDTLLNSLWDTSLDTSTTAIDTTYGDVGDFVGLIDGRRPVGLNNFGLWIVSGDVSAGSVELVTNLRVEKGATLTMRNLTLNGVYNRGEVDVYGTYKQTGALQANERFVVHDGGVLSYQPGATVSANGGYIQFMPGAIYEGQLTPSENGATDNMWTYVVNQEGNTVWRPKFADGNQYAMTVDNLNKLRGVELVDGATLTVSGSDTSTGWFDVGTGSTLKVTTPLTVSDLTVKGTLDTAAAVTIDAAGQSARTRYKTLTLDKAATVTNPGHLHFGNGAILSTNATDLTTGTTPTWWTDELKTNLSQTTLVTTEVAKVDASPFKYWQVRGTDSGESESTATSLPAETAVFADSKLKLDMTTLPSGKVIDNYGVVRLDGIKVYGNIIGGGTVEKTGTGTTVIETAQTYAGKTTISGGTLEVRRGADLTGNVVVNSGGIYKVDTAVADSEESNYNANRLMMLRAADARSEAVETATTSEIQQEITERLSSSYQHHSNSLTVNDGGVLNIVINSLADFSNEWTVSNIYLNTGSKLNITVGSGVDLKAGQLFEKVLYGWRVKGEFSKVTDNVDGLDFTQVFDVDRKAMHLLVTVPKPNTPDKPDKPIDHRDDGPIDPLLSGTGKRAVLGFMHDAWGTVKPFECQTENRTAWAKLIGSHDKLDNGDEWLGYSANHKGVAVGNEVCWGDKRVGVMLSYARTEADATRDAKTELHSATKHELKADSWLVGLYGEKVHSDEFYSDAEIAVGRSHLRGLRHIYEDGLTAKSKANANLFTAGYGINWVLPNAPWGMTHFARADFSKVWVGAYDETGAMDKNLSVAKDQLSELVLRIGTKAKKPLNDRWSFDTKVSVGVDVLNQNPATRARLLESDGPYKKVKNDEIGSLIGDFALGLSYKVTPQVQVNTNLNAQVRQNYHDVGAEVRFDYHF